MPRSNRGTRFEVWARTYFKGRKYLARDAWASCRESFYRPDYPEELRKARRESWDWEGKYRRALEEIAELKDKLQDRDGLINEFLLRKDRF
jgi:hypothetical protein